MKKIILVGFFNEIVELCESLGYEIVGIVDKNKFDHAKFEYLGDDQYILNNASIFKDTPVFLIPDIPIIRKKLFIAYKTAGFIIETIISPNAFISPTASIGEGCMIQTGCNISSNVKIGTGVRVNSLANVMHDSVIGDFSTLAPSSVILGRCVIGDEVYIGANSTILPEVHVNNNSLIGAGAVVIRDVKANVTVAGVPAVQIA